MKGIGKILAAVNLAILLSGFTVSVRADASTNIHMNGSQGSKTEAVTGKLPETGDQTPSGVWIACGTGAICLALLLEEVHRSAVKKN